MQSAHSPCMGPPSSISGTHICPPKPLRSDIWTHSQERVSPEHQWLWPQNNNYRIKPKWQSSINIWVLFPLLKKNVTSSWALVSRQPCSIEFQGLAVLWCVSHIYNESQQFHGEHSLEQNWGKLNTLSCLIQGLGWQIFHSKVYGVSPFLWELMVGLGPHPSVL